MSQELTKSVHNYFLWPSTSMAYNSTEDNSCLIIYRILQLHSPHLGGRSKDLPKHLYYLTIVSAEYMASFINRSYIIQKNIFLSQQIVVPYLLFEKFLTQIMACEGLLLSLAPSNLLLSSFDESVVAL